MSGDRPSTSSDGPDESTAQPAPAPAPAYGVGETNGLAIASLVCAILWMFGLGSLLALVFGYSARAQIDRSGGRETGRGLAVAGIVLGWVGVAGFLLLVLGMGCVASVGSDTGDLGPVIIEP